VAEASDRPGPAASPGASAVPVAEPGDAADGVEGAQPLGVSGPVVPALGEAFAAEADEPGEGSDGDGEGPERPLTRRGRNTYDRLVAAATDVFNQKPYVEARITEITALAGVATGSFYTYFESKEALFRIVAHAALDDMLRSPRRDPENPGDDPVRDIAYASREYFRACHRHRLIAQSIEQLTQGDADVRGSRRDTLLQGAKRAERWIVRLQDAGLCDPGLDPWYTGLALQAMNVSLAYDQLVHKDAHDQAAAQIEALVAAVTPIWARAVGLDGWL
jgi:AcrR family transcriptional regulator